MYAFSSYKTNPNFPRKPHPVHQEHLLRSRYRPPSHPPIRLMQLRCQNPHGKLICLPQRVASFSAVAGAVLLTAAFLAIAFLPANARVVTERVGESQLAGPMIAGREFGGNREEQARQSSPERPAKERWVLSIREQVAEVVRINQSAKEAEKEGQFHKALKDYTTITRQFPDLAISNYAKLGRAFMLYQAGNPSEAILELQDLESSLRGFAEVHAALASIVYSERPAEIAYAEQQFDLASEFDGRYLDVDWVAREKHWPPAMLRALDKFVNLR